jgi:hypothetical protein
MLGTEKGTSVTALRSGPRPAPLTSMFAAWGTFDSDSRLLCVRGHRAWFADGGENPRTEAVEAVMPTTTWRRASQLAFQMPRAVVVSFVSTLTMALGIRGRLNTTVPLRRLSPHGIAVVLQSPQ